MAKTQITIANWDARAECMAGQRRAIAEHAAAQRSDMVLLPEMPFSKWLSVATERDSDQWLASVGEHIMHLELLGRETGVAIAGTRPVSENTGCHNRAFLWRAGAFIAEPHDKQDLPAEEGYWESRWFSPGPRQSTQIEFGGIDFAFAICTELWNMPRIAAIGRRGVQVILAPRATPDFGNDIWLAAIRTAAVVSGCYVLSSNVAYPLDGQHRFEGLSAASDPDGNLLAVCDAQNPFTTVEIDGEIADGAKRTYPRYILREGPASTARASNHGTDF